MTTQLTGLRPGTGTPAPARSDATPPAAPERGSDGWWPTAVAAAAVALAALVLAPLLDGPWLGWPFATLVAVALTGGALAQLRAPLFLVPIAQALVCAVVLTAAYVPDAPLGFLPSPAALDTLRTLLQDGVAAANTYVAPVPVEPGLLALVTLGVGVCALCTHVLAVTLRMPVLAGAPLVAMYAVPAAALPDGAPWWAFVLISIGWVGMLFADTRRQVDHWGRVVPRAGYATARLRPGGWLWPGIRLAALAALLALVVPPLVPGLTDAVLGGRGSSGAVDAAPDPQTVALDPFVSMRRDLQQGRDVELFTYRTTSDSPAYLRAVVAETFDGEKWIPHAYSADDSPVLSQGVITPVSLGADVARRTADYQFFATRLASPYLPLPYPVDRIVAPDDWHWDLATGTAFSVQTTTKGLSWAVDAVEPAPTLAQLEASRINRSDTRERGNQQALAQLPTDLVDQAKILAEGHPTPYEQALAIQWWLRTEFTYSVDVKGDPTGDQIEQFLRDRVGYCQQFAATMALMARALNITSRVAVGFTPGTRDASGVWHVSSQDAHAWPELLFPGVGWVRFEPTPRASTDGGNVAVPRWARAQTLAELEARHRAQPEPTDDPARTPDERVDTDPATAAAEPLGDRVRRTTLLGLLALAVALAAVPGTVRVRRRRTRLAAQGLALAEGGWAELRDTVRDTGGGWSDADTPRQAARRLKSAYWVDPPASAAIDRLTAMVERTRYAPTGRPVAADDVARDLRTVRAAALRRLDARQRWRARWFPSSALRRE